MGYEKICTFSSHGRVKFGINQGLSVFKTVLITLINIRALIQQLEFSELDLVGPGYWGQTIDILG